MNPAQLAHKDQALRALPTLGKDRVDWKAIWAEIKEIGGAFKETQFDTSDERNASWEAFQEVVAGIKESQEADYRRRQERQKQSADHLAQIEYFVGLSRPDSGFGELALLFATGGMSLLAKVAMDAIFGKSDEWRDALNERDGALKRAWGHLTADKDAMTGRDKAAAFAMLNDSKQNLASAWAEWRSDRQAIVAQRNTERQERIEAGRAKHEAWKDGQRAFIDRLEHAEYKLVAALDHHQRHLEKLAGDYQGAWSDSYRQRIEGYIGEERVNIASIEEKLYGVRGKLSEVRLQLDS